MVSNEIQSSLPEREAKDRFGPISRGFIWGMALSWVGFFLTESWLTPNAWDSLSLPVWEFLWKAFYFFGFVFAPLGAILSQGLTQKRSFFRPTLSLAGWLLVLGAALGGGLLSIVEVVRLSPGDSQSLSILGKTPLSLELQKLFRTEGSSRATAWVKWKEGSVEPLSRKNRVHSGALRMVLAGAEGDGQVRAKFQAIGGGLSSPIDFRLKHGETFSLPSDAQVQFLGSIQNAEGFGPAAHLLYSESTSKGDPGPPFWIFQRYPGFDQARHPDRNFHFTLAQLRAGEWGVLGVIWSPWQFVLYAGIVFVGLGRIRNRRFKFQGRKE